MKTYLYRASNLKSTITWPQFQGGGQFLVAAKTHCFLQFINYNNNNNNHHQFHHQIIQTGFSECTEAITTSLMLIETRNVLLSGFSCTVWTKMRFVLAPEFVVRSMTPF